MRFLKLNFIIYLSVVGFRNSKNCSKKRIKSLSHEEWLVSQSFMLIAVDDQFLACDWHTIWCIELGSSVVICLTWIDIALEYMSYWSALKVSWKYDCWCIGILSTAFLDCVGKMCVIFESLVFGVVRKWSGWLVDIKVL